MPAAPEPYTAVDYVHGIGEQRRYAELARLVDALEVGTRGRLTGVTARLDAPPGAGGPPPAPEDRPAAHLVGTLATGDGPVRLRFSEVYWRRWQRGG